MLLLLDTYLGLDKSFYKLQKFGLLCIFNYLPNSVNMLIGSRSLPFYHLINNFCCLYIHVFVHIYTHSPPLTPHRRLV